MKKLLVAALLASPVAAGAADPIPLSVTPVALGVTARAGGGSSIVGTPGTNLVVVQGTVSTVDFPADVDASIEIVADRVGWTLDGSVR
jgi:hypothetical protein